MQAGLLLPARGGRPPAWARRGEEQTRTCLANTWRFQGWIWPTEPPNKFPPGPLDRPTAHSGRRRAPNGSVGRPARTCVSQAKCCSQGRTSMSALLLVQAAGSAPQASPSAAVVISASTRGARAGPPAGPGLGQRMNAGRSYAKGERRATESKHTRVSRSVAALDSFLVGVVWIGVELGAFGGWSNGSRPKRAYVLTYACGSRATKVVPRPFNTPTFEKIEGGSIGKRGDPYGH